MSTAVAAPNGAGGGLASFEKELICSICTEVLYQPLTILNCLHTFCGSCLKEWFSHQHRKASSARSSSSSTNPYSCPTCRAEVIDVQHNATVSNLLELFLAANPSRDRTQEDKDDMDKMYKPDGTRPRDKILPKVDRRRERRTRREGSEAARERRMIEDARQRSLADFDHPASSTAALALPRSDRARSTSAEREERRQRRRERERQRGTVSSIDVSQVHTHRHRQDDSSDSSPTALSPRHPDAVEARQREHRMAHQASLRSLVSASETGTGTGDSLDEAQIMQEILDEGLLGDIDVDTLNEEEQDRLAERIAELYRQRHPRLVRQSSPPQSSSGPTRSSSSPQPQNAQLHARHERPQRSSSAQRPAIESIRATSSGPRPRSNSARLQPLPPSSITRSNSQNSSSVTLHHRRRTSDQSQQIRATGRSRQASVERPPTSSSVTNLGEGRDWRPTSSTTRTNTDPTTPPPPRASSVWLQAGGEDRRLQQRRGTSPSRSPRHAATTPLVLASNPVVNAEPLSLGTPELEGSTPAAVNPSAHRYDEPSISCFRCQKADVQYEIHRYCRDCKLSLCMRCYRAGEGCNHWFGFGHAADINFENRKTTEGNSDPPHVLIGRQYRNPPPASIVETRPSQRHTQSIPKTTTSNPVDRLQEGRFCDRCGTFANAQFWLCDICNDGEWGFCKQCVQTHHCCTHPLLPVAYVPQSQNRYVTSALQNLQLAPSQPPNASTSRPTTPISTASRRASGYDYLSINVNCDMCHDIIFPSAPRYHCPFHSTDYDVCTSCYASFIAHARMRRDPAADLIAGWRQCPSGHRMIILAFEADVTGDGDGDGSIRRIVKADLIGGWKMNEADRRLWNQQHGIYSSPPTSPPLTTRGTWHWKEDVSGTKRGTRSRTSTLSDANSPRFPSEGGFGIKGIAYYAYWPEEGPDGEGELSLPRGAAVSEVEDVNGDWWSGVYAGDVGVYPFGYVKEVRE